MASPEQVSRRSQMLPSKKPASSSSTNFFGLSMVVCLVTAVLNGRLPLRGWEHPWCPLRFSRLAMRHTASIQL